MIYRFCQLKTSKGGTGERSQLTLKQQKDRRAIAPTEEGTEGGGVLVQNLRRDQPRFAQKSETSA